uniref:Uncharacterized protein n=1 Tax=Anopheles maculatus TaxID=74869 RepID=A0A182SKX5_9DIPT
MVWAPDFSIQSSAPGRPAHPTIANTLCAQYGGIRSGYQHFSAQGGQDSGFPSPRGALGYPFPPMHQNSYSGYHLGSYAPPCASPPKDGKFSAQNVPLRWRWK